MKPDDKNLACIINEFQRRIEAEKKGGTRLAPFHFAKQIEHLLCDARAECEKIITESRNSGMRAGAFLSQVTDEIVKIAHSLYFPGKTRDKNVALIALGGYGRGILTPYSDIDLLCVTTNTTLDHETLEGLRDFLCALWDAKLKVGHSVQTPAEALETAEKDLSFQTSLLDMRYLTGSKDIFYAFEARVRAFFRADKEKNFIRLKMAERENRHIKVGNSRYPVEPNIKEGKGGLRDLQTLQWMEKFLKLQGKKDPFPLFFDAADKVSLEQAEKFLQTLRFHLHFAAGKAEERLSFTWQQHLARKLGYRRRNGAQEAQRLMKQYFLTARKVGDLTRIFCTGLHEKYNSRTGVFKKLTEFFKVRKVFEKAFYLKNDRLHFINPNAPSENPELLVKFFRTADQNDFRLHPDALKAIRRALPLLNGAFRALEEPYIDFKHILCQSKNPEHTLRRMNEADILGKLIPEFRKITALTQFNMYHHYTADDHLIRTVGALKAIENGPENTRYPLANKLMREIHKRDALYLAVFLHDIAKGGERDHSEAGAEIALSLGKRLKFSENDTQLTAWLVRHHLVMSDTAQRRDLSDSEVIKAFAELVQTPERLRLLLILTAADIRAVGPGVWNGWKGELLRRLYYQTLDLLGGSDGTVTETERALTVKRAVDDHRRRNGLHDIEFPESYWRNVTTETALRHLDLIIQARNRKKDVSVEIIPDRFHAITKMSVYAPDYQGLFLGLTGALSASGVTVKAAKILAGPNGAALDEFLLQDLCGGAIYEECQIRRILSRSSETVETRKTDFQAERTAALEYKSFKNPFSIEPDIIIDNSSALDHTILEISAPDRPFLLYDLARALKKHDLSTASAHINTYGDKAVDIFYVKNKSGHKVTSEDAKQRLIQDLISAAGLPK